MNRVFQPGENLFERDWPRDFHLSWPQDVRKFMFWIFFFGSVGFLAAALYTLPHFHNSSLLRSLLVGPIFAFIVALLSGIAAWSIWKANPWARGWAIISSALHVLMFLKPFLISVPQVPDYHLISLVVGLVGPAAFIWPDRN